jgi:hypothetical protein
VKKCESASAWTAATTPLEHRHAMRSWMGRRRFLRLDRIELHIVDTTLDPAARGRRFLFRHAYPCPNATGSQRSLPGYSVRRSGNCSPPRLPVQPIVLGRPRRARLAIPPTEHFMRDRLGSHREMLDSKRNLAQAVGTTRSLIRRAHHTGWPSRGAIKLSADRHGPIVGLPGPRY